MNAGASRASSVWMATVGHWQNWYYKQASMNGLERHRVVLLLLIFLSSSSLTLAFSLALSSTVYWLWFLTQSECRHILVLSEIFHCLQSAQESFLIVLRRAERTLLRTPTSLTGGQLVAVLGPLAGPPEQRVAQEAGQGQAEHTEAGPPQPPGNTNMVRLRHSDWNYY